MEMMLSLILALSLSTLALPALIRRAGTWGLIDAPDARKHHVGMIPRVGGIAIALGTLLSATVWSFADTAYVGFLAGSLVIVVFGMLDDRNNLDFRIKFGGQIIAALIVAAFGIRLQTLPFFGVEAFTVLLVLFTVLFLLASTNAFNLLDGLDGLAAGCGILSLATISVLALTLVDGGSVVFIAAAALGGILGFLRYNPHPAIVYMGDAGSQFLGFAIGAVALLLIDRSGGAIHPAIVLPILGLPIIDTLLVMIVRMREGRSPFSPDRNHIHHRLLSLGLSHRQAVAAIYLVQATLVASAIILRNSSDLVIVGVYVTICAVSALAFLALRRHCRTGGNHGDRIHQASEQTVKAAAVAPATRPSLQRIWLLRYLAVSAAAYMFGGALLVRGVTTDIAVIALLCAGAAVIFGMWPRAVTLTTRLAAYVAVIYVSYLSVQAPAGALINEIAFYAWLGSVALALAVIMASTSRDLFQLSTQDLLTVLVVLAMVAMPAMMSDKSMIAAMAVRALVFLYACELIISLKPVKAPNLGFAAVASLVALATMQSGLQVW